MSRVLDFDPKIRNVQTLVPNNAISYHTRHRKDVSDRNTLIPAGITNLKSIRPQGCWPDLRGENPCG